MNMKQKCHFKQIILLFALGLFIFSCKNPLAQSQENQLSKETVKLKISTNLARTVLPTQFNAETLGLTWTLTGKKDGTSTELGSWSDVCDVTTGAVSEVAYSKMTSTEISVDVGTWVFTLDVTNGGKVLTGTTGSIDVSEDSTLTFVMQEPTGEGVAQGQIDFTLTFPAGTVGKVEATLTEYGETNAEMDSQTLTPSIGVTNASVTYTNTVSAGTYMLKLDLQQQDPVDTEQYKKINTYTCLIRVAPGLLSSGSYELTSLAKLYPVTFELNGGSLGENTTTYTVTYNKYQKIDLLEPRKQGFAFDGWYTDVNCDEPVNLDENGKFSITEGITLYAKWQEVSIPSITLDIKENGNLNNSTIIPKTDCIGISVAPNSDSESVWTYFGTVSPSSSTQGYTFQQGNNKVSIQMKASEKTVVAIAAARADMFFTVDTEWKTFEFNTGYLNEELTKAITIGVGLSTEVYFRNLTVTPIQSIIAQDKDNTLPTLSFDINKTGIQEYLNSENSNPIIQVSQEEAGYSIVVQASANNFDLSIRSYAVPSKLNNVNFTLQNVSDTSLTSSLLGFSVNDNEEDNSSDVNYWSGKKNYSENNIIVFPAFSNGDSSDLVPCVIQGIVDTSLEYNNSLSFSLLNFSSSSIDSLEDTGKVFAIKTGSDGNQNWQQIAELDDFSLEINGSTSSVLQVVITDVFEDEELDWTSNSYYCQFSNYIKDYNSSSLIELTNDTINRFTAITNNSSSKINCTAQIDSNFNVVISATEEQPAIPESGLALQIGTDGANDKIYVYNKTGLENLRNLVNGTIEGTLTVGIYEGTNTFNYDSSEGGYSDFNAILLNDIELDSTVEWTPIGTEDYPYIGTFDGNGKTVSGMNITQEANKVGFFYATNGATIKDLTIQGKIEFDGQLSYSYIGGFAGYSEETSYSNCINNVKITYSNYGYSYIGGLVGKINSCNFNNCINLAEINVTEHVGGIVGVALADSSNTFEKCINSGRLIASYHAGGIIGYNSDCEYIIKNSLNLADIGNDEKTATYLSGIIAPGNTIDYNQEVSYCLNLGELKGRAYLYPITSYEKSDDEKNYYDCTKNPSVEEEYGAVGKITSDLKIGNSFDDSWSTDNWFFESGRYPLPNISQNIPHDVWATVLGKAKE